MQARSAVDLSVLDSNEFQRFRILHGRAGTGHPPRSRRSRGILQSVGPKVAASAGPARLRSGIRRRSARGGIQDIERLFGVGNNE